jgi:hypothetical protein
MGAMIGKTQEDIIRVRELLGPVNDLVPDSVIIDGGKLVPRMDTSYKSVPNHKSQVYSG